MSFPPASSPEERRKSKMSIPKLLNPIACTQKSQNCGLAFLCAKWSTDLKENKLHIHLQNYYLGGVDGWSDGDG